ncbi:MAG: ferredoxin, partial [Campylobacterales bacterium]
EYNGTIIYLSNPILQFNRYTAKASTLKGGGDILRASKQFMVAAKLQSEGVVRLEGEGVKREIRLEVDDSLKGTIALFPHFDDPSLDGEYKYKRVEITNLSVGRDE